MDQKKKKKESVNTIKLIILGMLMERNLYGYEINKIIRERFQGYVDIKFGSIYYAIKEAIKKGYVKKYETIKDTPTPPKDIFKIEQAGRKQFKILLRRYFSENFIHFDVDIALMFLNSLTDDQKEAFIEERKELLKERLADIKKAINGDDGSDKDYMHIYTYLENHLKAENNWVKSL
ncbi:MAG: helix-turn-helix transcriptional regulator [Spirochaetes bacterium]|nr:helix-turn-helix transcriptional regulator [Spirochaetota bacterium]MBN2771482.1 helix-turn-helix transcriptional regulator [Spirochaetota bacterium]